MSIICIFLCAPFSIRAQKADLGDLLETALQWERVVYSSDDPSQVQDALIAKAGLYAEALMFEDALRTLDRIRMYLLSPDKASGVLLRKSMYSKESGDYGAALGYLEESGLEHDNPALYSVLLASSRRFSEAREQALRAVSSEEDQIAVEAIFRKAPKLKKEGIAAALSFLPPAGQIYLGRPWEGLLSMILNAGTVGFTVLELIGHDWVTGFLGGGLLLNETFLKGNISKNIASVEEANDLSVRKFVDSLEKLVFPADRP